MHEKRNFALVLIVAVALIWGGWAWLFADAGGTLTLIHRIASLLLGVSALGWLLHALWFEDKLTNYMKEFVGSVYYEVDGLSFLPQIRMYQGRPELCVFYLNRFENPVQAIVHLRPLHENFQVQPGWSDVHFAFRADGGDFGAIHQPIIVPEHLRGEVIEFQLAAASYYPRSHGAKLLKAAGVPCGTMHVDWGGAAFRAGVHEVSGEIELIRPTVMHLALPATEFDEPVTAGTWRQERIHSIDE
jgi:hypothetical protein